MEEVDIEIAPTNAVLWLQNKLSLDLSLEYIIERSVVIIIIAI